MYPPQTDLVWADDTGFQNSEFVSIFHDEVSIGVNSVGDRFDFKRCPACSLNETPDLPSTSCCSEEPAGALKGKFVIFQMEALVDVPYKHFSLQEVIIYGSKFKNLILTFNNILYLEKDKTAIEIPHQDPLKPGLLCILKYCPDPIFLLLIQLVGEVFILANMGSGLLER